VKRCARRANNVGTTSKSRPSAAAPQPLEPNVHEHGVDGYTENAVGGFGEDYSFQVAHGGESEEPGSPSDSELDANPEPTNPGALEQAVRKALGRAHIDAADLCVEATGASIRLSGSVRHLFEKAELETRARAVPGVSAVVSDLFVLRGGWEENP
jgi:hypothetical protein